MRSCAARLTLHFHHYTHMINRILKLVDEAQDDELPYGDFSIVSGLFGSVSVSPEVAVYIERQLDRLWRPAWIIFHDRVGSRMRVRSSAIRAIVECTTEQRSGDRRLDRARRKEEDADRRPWEDLD